MVSISRTPLVFVSRTSLVVRTRRVPVPRSGEDVVAEYDGSSVVGTAHVRVARLRVSAALRLLDVLPLLSCCSVGFVCKIVDDPALFDGNAAALFVSRGRTRGYLLTS